jgi:carnitine 3-dehydrogenase / betainyl-CoA thioesterase
VTERAALPKTVGLLGGGVIGGGWAARFLLHGADVRLFDPDPHAERRIGEVLENARRAWSRLTLTPLPTEGSLTMAESLEDAVAGVDFVQESAPEREDLKKGLLGSASRATPPDVVIATSTSGLLPSRLQTETRHPERMIVGHPFNPVYLLPLVEVCGGRLTSADTVGRASTIYRSVGMSPLIVRKEIEGFVADRLMEALWREALWLVHDDVATVEEIDDAIRLGAGMRWSFMGPFLTNRIAGGEAGMRHFMEQFGPALRWPWTKLTDVPELTDGLLDRLEAQSDAQAGGRSLDELERLRDDCLVAVTQALRSHEVGAGSVLGAHEQALCDVGGVGAAEPDDDPLHPLRLRSARILPEWIDYNGHTHESRYLQLFGDASDALLRRIGVDATYLAEGGSYFTVETHLSHVRGARVDERVHVTTQVLGFDEKRLHVFHSLYRSDDDVLLATAEQMLLHVDTNGDRAGPAENDVLDRVAALAEAHAGLPRPERAGRHVGLPARG